jgi:carboxypeptidase PM20D1
VLDPDVHVVPYVQTGGTDSRHFTRICDSVYRFAPLHMTRAQRDSIHAPNEKVAIDSLERGSAFHRALITAMV